MYFCFFCVPLTSATFSIYNRTLLRITTVSRLDIFCIVLFVRCHPINKILTRLSYLVNNSYISTQVFFMHTMFASNRKHIFLFSFLYLNVHKIPLIVRISIYQCVWESWLNIKLSNSAILTPSYFINYIGRVLYGLNWLLYSYLKKNRFINYIV